MPLNLRSLSKENLQIYIDGGQVYKWHFAADPSIDLFVDIPSRRLSISGIHDGTSIDTDRMRHCKFRVSHAANGEPRFDLSISPVEDWYTYYSFIEMVVKRIVDGQPQAQAVTEAIEIWNSLVATKPALGQEQEVGLIGELIFVEHLIGARGPTSLSSWTGPEREEHDFKFSGQDVEVKTTTQEARSHIIGSISQLKETQDKKLYLLSNQLTKAGAGGITLSELVDRVNQKLTFADSVLFLEKLRKSNYHLGDAALYKTRWELRTGPLFFQIDNLFPRLLTENLGLSAENLGRVSDISYRVNLEGIAPSNAVFADYQIVRIGEK
jgi:hypothetical protein